MEHGGEKDSECDPENKGLCYVLRIRIIIIPLWLGLEQAFSTLALQFDQGWS